MSWSKKLFFILVTIDNPVLLTPSNKFIHVFLFDQAFTDDSNFSLIEFYAATNGSFNFKVKKRNIPYLIQEI